MHSCRFETKARSSAIKSKPSCGKTAIDRHDRNSNEGKDEMSKIVRNAILAVVAVAGLASSAYAQQATINSCSNHDDYYGMCLGAANNGGHHESRGDRR
ncbi:hypothetical protein DPM33_23750 [Mesorhizobium hawassense]|uniref:Uncharacterized protein n=2 Tax=Mesorhizobium hawassense TaxID=1209954 RepID=A0A330HV17_9HYPH|nr:hypothetical protein DPM33_23750 [Mesorhizobium hawassense]